MEVSSPPASPPPQVPPSARRPESPNLAAVFGVSFAVLCYELALTSLFSAVMHYHLAFLAISLAICGLGLGGLGMHHLQQRLTWSARDVLALSAGGFAVSSLGATLLLLLGVFPYLMDWYWLSGVILLIPFIFAGVFFAQIFLSFPAQSGRIYASDLLGAAAAVVGVIGVLSLFGGINTCLAASLLGGVCAVLCNAERPIFRRVLLGVCLFLFALFAANLRGHFLDISTIRTAPESSEVASVARQLLTELSRSDGERPKVLETDWTAFARTDVVEHPTFGKEREHLRLVYMNGEVPTRMIQVDGDLRSGDQHKLIQGVIDRGLIPAAANIPFLVGVQDSLLFIGPGGGMDVLLGLYHGAKQLEGAELNPSILPLMRRYADYTGHIYELPNVHVVTAEGRSFLRQSNRKYDLIFSALTQSSASGQGVMLSESYIHTVDAFSDYWKHLTDSGRVAIILQDPTFTLRLLATTAAMMQREGLSDAEAARRIVIVRGPPPYSFLLLIKKSPIIESEASAIEGFAMQTGLNLMHLPLRQGILKPVESGQLSIQNVVDNAAKGFKVPLDLSPTGDDRPFVLDVRPGVLPALRSLCLGVIALIVIFCLLARSGRRGQDYPSIQKIGPYVIYYSCLGVGFMLIEIPLIQKLILPLGYPMLALVVTLFALLCGGGIGSGLSQRVADAKKLARLGALCALLVAVLTASFAVATQNSDWLLHVPFALRIALLVLALGLLGICLGVPFPTGIRMLAAVSPRDVPWMWGLNGVASVVGSLVAAMMAKVWGFQALLLLGAAIYVGVALLMLHQAWLLRAETR